MKNPLLDQNTQCCDNLKCLGKSCTKEECSKSTYMLQQSWWHIEDQIEPSEGRKVIRVQDFLVDKNYFNQNNSFPIKFLEPYIIEFKARNKNSRNELSFIEDYNSSNQNIEAIITVNLGDSDDWPSFSENQIHIKTEYEFTNYQPLFERRGTIPLGVKRINPLNKNKLITDNLTVKERFDLIWPPGYAGQFVMGLSQGEISITVPPGMKLKNKGNETEIILYKGPVESGTGKVKLNYIKPPITLKNNKRRYHYIIDEESYKEVQKTLKKITNIHFLVAYDVKHQAQFFIVPVLAAIIFTIGFLQLLEGVDYKIVIHSLIYYTILFIYFSALYLSLRKDNYQIPFNNPTKYLLGVNLFLLYLPVILSYYLNKVVSFSLLLNFIQIIYLKAILGYPLLIIQIFHLIF